MEKHGKALPRVGALALDMQPDKSRGITRAGAPGITALVRCRAAASHIYGSTCAAVGAIGGPSKCPAAATQTA